MDLINKVDNGVDMLLSNHILYTVLVVFLIIAIVFTELYDVIITRSGINNYVDKKVFIFFAIIVIAYLLNKDVRIGILLALLLLTSLEKNQINEVNNRLVRLIVEDIKNDDRLNKLEYKMNQTSTSTSTA
jgi:hypothetical protein